MNNETQALAGKKLLITGGTGTFGNAVLRRLQNAGLSEIRIFSRDEKKQDDMRRVYTDDTIKWQIGDVRDAGSLRDACVGVDYVFHAAALKQVPSCEFYPIEAIRTNAIGAANVIDAAVEANVSRVVVLSTDKAAYPINAMGLSKAMMEKIMIAKARSAAQRGTILSGTRYGNVMVSRGSVIPLFIEQSRAARNLTVTDPRMTRFLMSIDEAVDLVLYAFTHGEQGDMFVRKAPAATIETLVQAVQRLCGTELPVSIIGTRHGEKLFETLLTREEMVRAEDHGDYFRVVADKRDLNYHSYFTDGERAVSSAEDYHSHNTQRLDVDELTLLLEGVPEVQELLRPSA